MIANPGPSLRYVPGLGSSGPLDRGKDATGPGRFDVGLAIMNRVKGYRLLVNLSASQARRRVKGLGFGIRKVESAGKNQAMIVHTATGDHLQQLRALLADVLAPIETPPPPESAPPVNHDAGGII